MLSSGDDTDDSDSGPIAGPSRSGPTAGPSSATTSVAAGVRARRRRGVAELSSDSDIEVVSERPASQTSAAGPSRLSRYGDPIGSPPPFIVPPGATATSSASTAGRSQPRRSTRARTGPGAPSGAATTAGSAAEDADALYARALADAEAAALGYEDYETAQRSAAGTAGGGGRRGGSRGGGAGSSGRGRGFGGVFGHGGGGHPREGFFQDYLTGLFMGSALGPHSYFSTLLGGGFWGGGAAVHGGAGSLTAAYGGGPYGGGTGGGPGAGGWGGAAKVKAASKKYGVRMSHPTPNERGFSRDIVEPRGPEAPLPPLLPPAAASGTSKRGRSKAVKSTKELEPVCASCLERLLLSGTGDHKVFALRCGHAVCAKCLDEAKGRCRAIREQEKGGWVIDTAAAGTASSTSRRVNGTVASKRKGKNGHGLGSGPGGSDSAEVYLSSSEEDEDDQVENRSTAGAKSSVRPNKRRRQSGATAPEIGSVLARGNKGKGKSRADETGVEEAWTTCPVSTCDGRGTDLLAEEGWSRPFEFFT